MTIHPTEKAYLEAEMALRATALAIADMWDEGYGESSYLRAQLQADAAVYRQARDRRRDYYDDEK